MSEICGDGLHGPGKRLRYIVRNVFANLFSSGKPVPVRYFRSPRTSTTSASASLSRILTEAFLSKELPSLLPIGHICVLEIGCGSGRVRNMLANLDYRGSYWGIDIADCFDHAAVTGFDKTFLQADALTYAAGSQSFDLVISISALEYIPNDVELISRTQDWFARGGGVEVDFVPSGWALFAYLWHGWRQYPLRRIGDRFGGGTKAVAFGGLSSTLVHNLRGRDAPSSSSPSSLGRGVLTHGRSRFVHRRTPLSVQPCTRYFADIEAPI